MLERCTEKARRAIFFAHYEASQFGSPNIESEHLLLGLLREDHTAVKRYLSQQISHESIREEIEAHTNTWTSAAVNLNLPFSDECKRVLAYAAEEAFRLGNRHIGTEHLLLGLLREEDCYAAQMLQKRGVMLEQIRREISVSSPVFHLEPGRPEPQLDSEGPIDEAGSVEPIERRQQPRSAFEKYTEKARRALFFARFEACQFGTTSIETEHLLLGLLREGTTSFDLFVQPVSALQSIRAEIERRTPPASAIPMSVDLLFTEECRRALNYGIEEAHRLRRELIGPEHLLMGILREDRSFAAEMLRDRGADLEKIRKSLAERFSAG